MATEITAISKKQYGQAGAIDTVAVKFEGMVGHSTGGVVVNVIENPFGEDMLILEAYVAITTLDSTDGDIDIGLADDVDGGSIGNEIVDSMVHSAKAIHSYQLWAPAVTGVSPPIWKAANAARTATDSWIASKQNTSTDAGDLVYNLTLVCAREAVFQ